MYWSRLVAGDSTGVMSHVLSSLHAAVSQAQEAVNQGQRPGTGNNVAADLLQQQMEGVPGLLREQRQLELLQQVDTLVNGKVKPASLPAAAAAGGGGGGGDGVNAVNPVNQVDRLVAALTGSGLTYNPMVFLQGSNEEEKLYLSKLSGILHTFKAEGRSVTFCLHLLEAVHDVVQYNRTLTSPLTGQLGQQQQQQQQGQMQLGHWQLLLLCAAWLLHYHLQPSLAEVLRSLEANRHQLTSLGDTDSDAPMAATHLVPVIIKHLQRVEVEVKAVLSCGAARAAALEALAVLKLQQQAAWQQLEAVLGRLQVGGGGAGWRGSEEVLGASECKQTCSAYSWVHGRMGADDLRC
jgi:hypothetical protein